MQAKRILILGGTGLGRQAADALVQIGHDVTSSLAGVTHSPHLPKGKLRKGGFGGVEGLEAYLKAGAFDVVVDATHAFAAKMSAHAYEACNKVAVKLLRLQAPEWQPLAGDDWREVETVPATVEALPQNAKVVVTVGRKEVGPFFARADLSGVARMIEQAEVAASYNWQVMLERPPFTLEAEIDLLRSSQAEFLVSKNAGGARPAKLGAAAALALPVIMVRRPFKPVVQTLQNVDELVAVI
ncbi:MAG TPA: cobalt-precorrin-6A reductase [Aestuariivirga sp.]